MNAEPRYTADQLIERYIQLRDEAAAVSERHKAELAPFNRGMELIESKLQDMLNQQGGDSIKTPHGTAYLSSTLATKVVEWEALFAFIQERADFELLVRGVNKTRVKEILESGETVPGVGVETINRLNVRRA